MRKFALLLALTPLMACDPAGVAGPGQRPVSPEPGQDSCGAAPHRGMIGQDATALERVLIIGQVRVIRPDMAVTMDYRAERINFDIDRSGRIARIWCG